MTGDASGGVGHRAWWGPRIWCVLHTLAEVSEGRPDTSTGWRMVLRTTASFLPCKMCRDHFGAAIRGWNVPTGVRHGLWAAHAAVGGVLPEADLASTYGGGCDAVLTIVTEVGAEFRRANVLDRFRAGYLGEWEHAVRGLVQLLRLPPTPALQAGSQRTTPALQAGRRVAPSGASPAGHPTSHRGRPIRPGHRRA